LEQEARLVADRDSAKNCDGASSDPVRDKPDATTRRELVPVGVLKASRSLPRSRLTDTLFLAHLFATRFREPQTREKRRADPADADASYRKGTKPPAKTGRLLSKKI
jgi:hypothetical protein